MTSQSDEKTNGLSGLRSDRSVKRLAQIASLRARGLSKDIDLPQLVVCGDQSAGKSSVLEGLSHIPFPRDEGVCTKFPTQVILEQVDQDMTISATIIPHTSRSDEAKTALQKFIRNIDDIKDLPDVIAKAAFVEDVLRIKVTGRTGLHLSIVDLPGLISTASEEQTEADVETVHRMVDSYIEKPRTIILAVVQASNDIANQVIVKKSRGFDKAGQRTVGIITKPDLINQGAERRIATLAKNQDTTKLHLGFFLLKNPTPMELKGGMTPEQRASNELRFFQSSPWREQMIDPGRVGIEKLRDFLQKLLDQHIEKQLPNVRNEIKAMIRSTEQELVSLPKERPTAGHLRMFLADLAMRYHNLVTAALNGDYHTSNGAIFTAERGEIGSTRLRALIHSMNTKFANGMRDKGKWVEVAGRSEATKDDELALNSLAAASSDESDSDPICVSEQGMKAWIKELRTYARTRGRELPGNYNHALLTELFHQQSKKWPSIARRHLEAVYETIATFAQKAIEHLKVEEHVRAEISEVADTKLQQYRNFAEEELTRLCTDEEQQPITYNHYFTDNVQKSRRDSMQGIIYQAVELAETEDRATHYLLESGREAYASALQKQIIVDMDEQACSEALAGLNAYYKVALKMFVDNVCRQVVERHFVRNLPNVFSPQDVAGYSDERLALIAGEREDVIEKRKQLQEHLENLKAGFNDLRK